MAKEGQPTSEEIWVGMSTPEERANIIRGIIQMAKALGLTGNQASEIFANLDGPTADGVALMFGRVADGQVVRDVGRSLGKK